jgi:hypothetical protein
VLKATLAISDLHWGGIDHMPRTRRSILERAAQAVNKLAPDELEVVENGDATVGAGIWRSQAWTQIMPDVHAQTWGAAWILSQWVQSLSKPPIIKLTKGNHDRSADGTDLGGDLALKLFTMGITARFCGSETIVNLAPKGAPEHNCLFEHGYGGSSYYPFGYSLLRNTERKLLTYQSFGRHISRCCFGHSHWLAVDHTLTPWLALDCTGGCQRNDRAILGRGIRSSGAILYVHDGTELDVRPIKPDDGALRDDLQDGALEATNRAEIAEVLESVLRWMTERGLIEPDVIAKAAL